MSRATSLIPVILLLGFVGGAAYIGYQIFLYSQELANRGQKHMEKKNIKFTADGGMRVGVKELKTEDYSSKTQDIIVKAWNLSSWPEYRSRFWNKDAQAGGSGGGGKQQHATSR
ncbi:MAG: hypothetical protein M1831_005997 [Alyxoria varia]|nr:MAG: hypothetical protein M1831_005997 [Alyxoria varia]